MSISREIKNKSGNKTKTSDWYAKQLRDILNRYQKIDSDDRDTFGLKVGQLYFFQYNPQKPRKNLRYDRNPLAFILEIDQETIFAVNLHHASPQIRKIMAKSLLNKLDAPSIPRDCYRRYYLRGCNNFQKVPERYWEDVSEIPSEKFFSIDESLIVSNKSWEDKS